MSICVLLPDTGVRIKLDHPVWITTNRNGIVVTPERVKAKGVGDGEHIWSLGELEGYPEAKLITLAEFLEVQETDPDPELSAEEALNIILGGSYETE